MSSVRRLSLLILPVALTLLVAACGQDPTPTSPPPPESATATPEPEPVLAQEVEGTYVLRDFGVEDGRFGLRMGNTASWGCEAGPRPLPGARPRTAAALAGAGDVGPSHVRAARIRRRGRQFRAPHGQHGVLGL